MPRRPVSSEAQLRLIAATLRLLGSGGAGSATTRAILREAGLQNASAVSYHFGSKEELIRCAMREYYNGTAAIFDALESDSRPPAEALLGLCFGLSEYVRGYEGLERNLLGGRIGRLESDSDFAQVGTHNFDCLKRFIAHATGLRDDKEVGFRAISLMSCLYYPFVLGEIASPLLGEGPESSAYYVSLVQRTLAVPV